LGVAANASNETNGVAVAAAEADKRERRVIMVNLPRTRRTP
jgi:hypothetical protein